MKKIHYYKINVLKRFINDIYHYIDRNNSNISKILLFSIKTKTIDLKTFNL